MKVQQPFKEYRGYSIIELMIVLVIVAILMSVAIPLYKDYVKKTRVLAVIQFLSGYEEAMSLYYNKHGEFPETLHDIPSNIETSSASYPDNVEWILWNSAAYSPNNYPKGWLAAKLNEDLGGGTVSIAAVVDNAAGVIKFSCGFWDSDAMQSTQQYLPAICTELNQENL